ncbi:MAG TPA: hypothetical protein VHA77_02560 [Xanthobacteraceae bacterium]|nr:hypothetical protein [Xanthobacteraceae bacterium]
MSRTMIQKLIAAATAALIGSASLAMAAPHHHIRHLAPGYNAYNAAPLHDVYDHAKGDIKDH